MRHKRVVILLVFLSLFLSLVFAFRAVLTPFLVAIFAAYLLDPVVERMAPVRIFRRIRLGRGGAIIILYLVFVFSIYLGSAFAIPALGRQLRQARDDLPAAQASFEERIQRTLSALRAWWGEETSAGNSEAGPGEEAGDGDQEPAPEPNGIRFHLKGGGVIEGKVVERSETQAVLELGGEYRVIERSRIEREERLSPGLQPIDPREFSRKLVGQITSNLDEILAFTLGFVVRILRTFAQLVLVMMVTAFLLIDRKQITTFMQSVPPKRYQSTWKHLLVYMDRGLAGVIRGQLSICAVNGLLTWIGLQFLGVHYAGLLGFIAGVFSLIPIFGTILSTFPIVLIAWGAGTFYQGLLALAWILLIHFIEANFLNPKIMGTASKIHPVVIIFALIAGEHAYGIVGALLAVPAASIIQSCFKFYVIDRQHEVAHAPQQESADAAPVKS